MAEKGGIDSNSPKAFSPQLELHFEGFRERKNTIFGATSRHPAPEYHRQ